jgi:hypothetical protein
MTATADINNLFRQYDVEDVKLAVKSVLAGPMFIEALRRVEREKADGLELPHPASFYTTGRLHLAATPACELISLPSGQTSDDLRHQIIVAWTLADTDEERLDSLVVRYLTATAYALIANRGGSLLPDVPCTVSLGRRDYMPPDRQQTPLTQTGIIEVFASVVGLQ